MAARLFSHLIRTKPNAVLGLATGGTPCHFYPQLIQQNLDWSQITSFNLDEYIRVGAEHPQSYHALMHENLFRHVNINRANIHIPDDMAADPETFCCNYEKKNRAAGGIDLQLLSIGSDGHIGFNEATSSLTAAPAKTTPASSGARMPCLFISSPWASEPSSTPAKPSSPRPERSKHEP
jgi:glucosamine-6-phosphate deaminase